MKKKLTLLSFVLIFVAGQFAFSQESEVVEREKSDSTNITKEEKNRNVMLNAEANTGPREVNIGLPFRGDIVILENELPVVAYFWPTIPTYAWRMSNSLSGMGLLSFAESALKTGDVGFAVRSEDRGAASRFRGYASLYTNDFGSSKYDVTVTGPLSKNGWGYMINAYQHNERGNGTNYQFASWESRTSMLKGALEKEFNNGSVRLIYKYVDSKSYMNNYAPVMYLGDGETEPLDNFDLGTDSYIIGSGELPYRDPYNGETGWLDLTDDEFSRSVSHNIYLTGDYEFNNGLELEYSTMYQEMNTPIGLAFPISAQVLDNVSMPAGYPPFASYYESGNAYEGDYVQLSVSQIIPQSDVKTFLSRAEFKKKISNHNLRLGFTYQYNKRKYQSYGGMYAMTVEANPKLLTSPYLGVDSETGLMGTAGGFGSITDDSFDKTALYISDDFSPTYWLDLSMGARIENQNRTDKHYTAVSGNEPVTAGGYIEHEFENDWNKVGTASAIIKLTKNFGILGSITYNSWWDKYWDYAYRDENNVPVAAPGEPQPRSTVPKSYEQEVIYYDAGLFLNLGRKLNIVSKITNIQKNHIPDHGSLITYKKDANQKQDVGPIFYGINTFGWSTDIVTSPIKNFNLHVLLTLQKPEYKNYSFTTRFTDPETGEEDVEHYNYNGKVIPALSETLIEIDPSYSFMKRKMKAWFSLRYYGRQYGNRTNAFEYNGWWENFGGLEYTMSRNVKIGLQVVNFLDEKGVKGEVQGGALLTKQDVQERYVGHPIVASYIRPRTFELKVDFKF
jgi:hypothetical protein